MKRNLTIKSRIFLVVTVLLACTYALPFFVSVTTLQRIIEDQTAKSLAYSLQFAKNQFSARQELVIEALKLPAANRAVQQLFTTVDREELQNFAKLWAKSLDFLEILTLLDAEHNVIARSNGARAPQLFLKREQLHSLFERKQPIISVEVLSHAEYCREAHNDACQALPQNSSVMVQFVFLPVIDAAGKVIGAIIAGDEVNREPYLPIVQQKVFDATVETIVTQQGELIASTLTDVGGLKPVLDPHVLQALKNGFSFQGATVFNDRQYEMSAEPISNHKGDCIGAIAVAIRLDRFAGLTDENYRNMIVWGLVCSALMLLLGYWVTRQFTASVTRFSTALQAIEAGDYSVKIPESGQVELKALAKRLNSVTAAVSQREALLLSQISTLSSHNETLERRVQAGEARVEAEISGNNSLIHSLVDGLIVTDDSQIIIILNQAAEKLLGVQAQEMIGAPLAKLYTLPGLSELEGVVQRIGGDGFSSDESIYTLMYNGRKLRFAVAAIRAGEVSKQSLLLNVSDLTADEEVARLKSGFIAKVSHELKTPLTSMKGSLQFILKKGKWLTGVEREMLTVCCRNTERLINLVGGIIELSRIEAGQIAFTMKPVQIGEVVLYALEEVKGAALVRNISLVNDVPMDLPKVIGDYERLMQVLSNLLSNAIKFSPENSVVTLSAAVDKDVLTIAVADDGKVIPEEARAALFSTFQQMGRPEDGEFCGSGLGLAICREILERHNGSIFYTPGAGKGNVFAFSLPVHGEGNGAEQDTYC